MNKYICILPWVHLHIAPDGDTFPCGICTAPERKIGSYHSTPSIEHLMNSSQLKNLRKQMLNAERPECCEKCWTVEEADPKATSMRKHYTLDKLRPYLGLIRNTATDGHIETPALLSIDIRFSNICNFKCRMCNPKQSFLLAKEWGITNPNNSLSKTITYSSKNQMILDDIISNLTYLKRLEFAGGECLIQDEHYLLLERLIELKRTDIELIYSTNLSTLKFRRWDALSLWEKFDKIDLRISLDHSGQRGEYIRKGLVWNNLVENLATVKQRCPQIKLGLNCVVSLFNIFTLNEFIETLSQLPHFNEQGLQTLRLSLLHWPPEQSITNLPEPFKNKIANKFIESPLPKTLETAMQGVLNFMMHSPAQTSHLSNFFLSNFQLDDMRKDNLLSTFPELRPLYDYTTKQQLAKPIT